MSIRAIIFDCFGVLVGQGFNETYALAGGDPLKDADFIQNILHEANMGMITSEQMRQAIVARLGIGYQEWELAVSQAELPNLALLDFIRSLKPNYSIGILSNANVGTLERKLSKEQLGLFDAVVVSAEVQMIKPQAEIYRYTATQLGVKPTECVFTDDNAPYCDSAAALGMKTILYDNFKQFKQELGAILSSQ